MHTDSWIALILAYVAFVLYGLLQWEKQPKTAVRERVKAFSFRPYRGVWIRDVAHTDVSDSKM